LFWRFQLIGLVGSRSLGVEEAVADREDLAERAGLGSGDGALHAGKKRELGGDAHKAAEFVAFVADAAGGGEVDAEGFLGEEVFAGAKHVEVEGLVEVVRHGDVNHIDVGAGEKHAVIGVEVFDRWHLAEPVEGGGVDVAHGNELGTHRAVEQ
jgi:hypothetical protein